MRPGASGFSLPTPGSNVADLGADALAAAAAAAARGSADARNGGKSAGGVAGDGRATATSSSTSLPAADAVRPHLAATGAVATSAPVAAAHSGAHEPGSAPEPGAGTTPGAAPSGGPAAGSASFAGALGAHTTSASAGTTAAGGPAGVANPYGARLAEAAQAVHDSITLQARNGVSQARIQLSPESLGGVQIHLTRTSEGLIARVVAEHPEAAQTLAQSGDDLRRQLQQGGTTLLRLDIGSSGTRDGGAQDQSGSASGTPGEADGEAPIDAATAISTDNAGQGLSSTTLVNVLA